ncbi:PREDICTED: WEB family protein At5g55860 [Tarenaya hassleriana]|uniref:WEB family protein At5g55860 n=1 Tax=Tarenaya hassleriana TaxID=28532 RepID=UPI00053C8035|nr:PREDICTED: WEB family protein At5g55860 [Tarenaya hassleriana]XP_010545281.1 PREDICTED: WEB family protein At5g55860 [Tarenaya hassleriana]XP_019058586.1 PREDICTED: WEB family protein At5g55860 [Tarenaya hassleriana]
MVAKGRRNSTGSSKVEVGEIDTSAPFQSVKDAVTLFGESAHSGENPVIRKANPQSAERVLAKESQLHLAQKELNKLKEQLKNAETTKEEAMAELEQAKRTVNDLTCKLKVVNESKDSAIKVTEAAKCRVKQIEEAKSGSISPSNDAQKQDMENVVERYGTVLSELDIAKQELRKIRQDSNEISATKTAAINTVGEAKKVVEANSEKIRELREEISAANESVEQVKLACLKAQKEHARIFEEKDVQRLSYKARMEESAKKLLDLKNGFDPEHAKKLELQLAETYTEINSLQKQMENAKASDMDSVRSVTVELDDAKESLKKLVEEEKSLQELIESRKTELENVKKEHDELKGKEAATESMAGNLHLKLTKSKSELEACLAEESKTKVAFEDMMSTLNQLFSETETARQESEEMRIKAEELRKEAEAAHVALEYAELDLRVALDEVEEAKASETRALEQIKSMSEKTDAARTSTSESGGQITMSREEFESLSRKVEESDKLAEMRVGAALAQVEAVRASENEALKKLEMAQKDIEGLKAATQEALKKAEMAEAAKKAVEGELRRWREREQKKAAEAASRILAETEKVSTSPSPHHHRITAQRPAERTVEIRKLEKAKTSVVSKKVLVPNLSGIFQRKKNQIEGGSPSYLPGEKPI